jgi:hypothetical protein
MDAKKYGQTYEPPKNRDEFVDVEKGAVIDKKDIPPIEIIKEMAKRYNVPISDPNKSCNKCYGRGYSGLDAATQAPTPCSCLFRGRTAKEKYDEMQRSQGMVKMNHDARRRMKKEIHKRMQRTQKNPQTFIQPAPVQSVSATSDVNIFTPKTPEAING